MGLERGKMESNKKKYLEMCNNRKKALIEKMVFARNGRNYAANERKLKETQELFKELKKQKDFCREKLNHRERRIFSEIMREK